MKKRKELDALVTNGSRAKLTNNKKKSMPSHKEEGHELLLNIESDSASSLDLDFSPPKRTFVRKPHVCSLCLSSCVLVLLVASLLMSIALLWMNFDLKKDVDGLRKRLELVEKESGISKSQLDSTEALINGLEKNINDSRDRLRENVQRMDLKLVDINSKVVELNSSSLTLKSKVQSLLPKPQTVADDPQLQKVVAGLGSEVEELKGTVQDVQSSQKHQQEDIQSLSKNVADLKVNDTLGNLSTISTTVSGMSQQPSQPSGSSAPQPQVLPTSATPLDSQSATKAPNSTQQVTGSTVVTSYLEQELQKLSAIIGAVNASLFTIEQKQSGFDDRLQGVELLAHNIPLGVQAVNSTVTLVDILKLQSDVKTLMADSGNMNSSLSTGDVNLHDIMTMRAQIAVFQLSVDTLTDKVNQLSSPDLNNNLLNMNTTLGIQTIMTNSLKHFKDENIENLNDIKFLVSQIQIQTQEQQEAIDDLESRLDEMQQLVTQVMNTQGSLTNKPTNASSNPESPPVSNTNSETPPASNTNTGSPTSDTTNTPETVTANYDEGLLMATRTYLGGDVQRTTPSMTTNSTETFKEANLPPRLGFLELSGVNTIDDVRARFNIWNMEKGYINIADMENFLGAGFKGNEQLEQFDYDNDSKLSEAEVIAAFGFQDVHNRRRIDEGLEPTSGV